MADVEANRALAEAHIGKQLGFSIRELRNRGRKLSPPRLAGARFKRYKNHVDEHVRASTLVAQRAASVVVRGLGETVPPFGGLQSAREIREEILRQSPFVDLGSLLEYCWKAGIAVLPLSRIPRHGKRFDGMAAFVAGRPVIVLASARDADPWLAFYLAHELGHVMTGHVRTGTEPLVDGTLGTAGAGGQEREADRFACELLTGEPSPRIPDLRVNAPRLATIAAMQGQERGIDPGVFALVYARSNDRWPVAQNALKHLDRDHGGQQLIAEHLERRLAGVELSEEDERFVSLCSTS